MGTPMFHHVQSAQESARWWRREAQRYVGDKSRAKYLAEATRRYKDGLMYLRSMRPPLRWDDQRGGWQRWSHDYQRPRWGE